MRIVLDTNQLVRALMRPPQLATFIMSWEGRRFTVVCSRPLLAEYAFVLQRPEIAELIYPELRRVFIEQLQYELEMIAIPEHLPAICRDPSDDKLIATALYGGVDYLVTADADLSTEAVSQVLLRQNITVLSMDELIAQL
jgi:putative PIN family toxin of toxin-antitoxin system